MVHLGGLICQGTPFSGPACEMGGGGHLINGTGTVSTR